MTTWMWIAAATLGGIWLVETALFVLSYRTSRRSTQVEPNAESTL